MDQAQVVRAMIDGIDNERAVIGSMVLDAGMAELAISQLSATDFATPGLALMFSAIEQLRVEGRSVDALTMGHQLEASGQLEAAGGAGEIASVLVSVPHAMHCPDYVRAVRLASQRRQLEAVCGVVGAAAADKTRDLMDLVAELTARLDEIQFGVMQEQRRLDEVIDAALEQRDNPAEVYPTGFAAVDRLLRGGVRGGQFVVIGARPGAGKSVIGGQIALHAAELGHPVLMVSLEMTGEELAERYMVAAGGSAGLRDLPVWFEERAVQADRIYAAIRLAVRRRKVRLVVVDYLQLIEPVDHRQPREQQVSGVSRGLKRLAMQLRIPVVALCQLNRESLRRETKRPQLSDLRESGAIEQDADIVAFVHRPEMYDPDDRRGEADFIVSKHRAGETGVVRLTWRGDRVSFADYARPDSSGALADWA